MTNRDPLTKALWLCEDVPYSVYKEVVREQIGRTGDKNSHKCCEPCECFRLELQHDGGCLKVCAVTGEQLIWRCGELIKSDRCPFKEVKNV